MGFGGGSFSSSAEETNINSVNRAINILSTVLVRDDEEENSQKEEEEEEEEEEVEGHIICLGLSLGP